MCKKLLVFSLAFCLGLLSLQLFKLNNETSPQKTIADSTISDNSQSVQINQQSPIADFFHNFQRAVAKDDRKAVVSLINFPIEVQLFDKKHQPYYKIIKNENEFLLNYDKIFDESFRIFIARRKTSQLLFSTSGEIFIMRSEIRIKPFYTNDNGNFEVKIISLKYPSYQ